MLCCVLHIWSNANLMGPSEHNHNHKRTNSALCWIISVGIWMHQIKIFRFEWKHLTKTKKKKKQWLPCFLWKELYLMCDVQYAPKPESMTRICPNRKCPGAWWVIDAWVPYGPQGVCSSEMFCQQVMMMNGACAFVCFRACRFNGPLTIACWDKLPVESEVESLTWSLEVNRCVRP